MEKEFAKGLEVISEDNGNIKVKCKGRDCIHVDKERSECGIVGSLLVLIPKISMAGVWQITTRSFNSIVNVNSSIALASEEGRRRIAMMPAFLHRRPQQTKHDGQASTHYILHLGINNYQAQAQLEAGNETLELPEADESVEAVAIRGEEVDEATGELPDDKFIAGLKEDADEAFAEFVIDTKTELRALTGDNSLYDLEMEEFNVKYLKETNGNVQVQKAIRDKLEAAIVDVRKVNKK
jgi:hypothetical protein